MILCFQGYKELERQAKNKKKGSDTVIQFFFFTVTQ